MIMHCGENPILCPQELKLLKAFSSKSNLTYEQVSLQTTICASQKIHLAAFFVFTSLELVGHITCANC